MNLLNGKNRNLLARFKDTPTQALYFGKELIFERIKNYSLQKKKEAWIEKFEKKILLEKRLRLFVKGVPI